MRLIITIIILVFISNSTFSQNVNFKRKFITFKNTRFLIGAGLDMSFSGKAKNGPMYYYIGTPKNIGIRNYSGINGFGIAVNMELYSPNSFLGFYAEGSYTTKKFMIEEGYLTDTIQNNTIDVPFYLKFRFGKIEKRSFFYTAIGAGYVIPLKSILRNEVGYENLDKSKAKGYPYISTIIGYEVLLGGKKKAAITRDNAKFLFFIKTDIDLKSYFNNDYNYDINQTNFDNSTNYDIRFIRINVGFRLMLRLNKVAKEYIDQINK